MEKEEEVEEEEEEEEEEEKEEEKEDRVGVLFNSPKRQTTIQNTIICA